MITKRQKRTFTLVEMLIVVVIIGILAAALIPRLVGAQERARDTARKGHLNNIVTGLTSYYNDIGIYTGDATTDDMSDIKKELVPKYLESIPTDPQSQRRINHVISADGSTGLPGAAGQYGYAPLFKNGTAGQGVVVIANTEGDLSNANWVYEPGRTDLSSLARCGTDSCGSQTNGARLGAGMIVTTGTSYTEATSIQASMCNTGVALNKAATADSLDTCEGRTDDVITYIVVK